MSKLLLPFFMRFAGRLRRPYLFGITAALFVVNVFVPDFVPFIDEILLGLATVILGSLKKKKPEPPMPADAPKSKS